MSQNFSESKLSVTCSCSKADLLITVMYSQVPTRAEQPETGLGDSASDRRAAVGVEETPLAEDEHQVPEGRNQQTTGHCQGSAGRYLHLGRLHGAA